MPSKRMLIDAAHPEETRVVVVDGSRLEEYDVEVASRRQLKGNIYLAKITRVEPSLQAAFVDYGGNRHGFLAFNEIHPDYYQIPVADRERLLAEEAAMVREAEARAAAEDGEEGEGGLDDDDDVERRHLRHPSRHYKIQEVIKRRQIMLVQVAKEERGNKGAALTTYLSLAGRYCVLMPNTARGGGISRKITNANDRKRLKKILVDLEVPEGMAVIVRTAGAGRSKAEIKRDYEYLMRLWGSIRETTLSSTAPALVYEEGSLIKRSIRDHYERDIEEIIIQGEPEYKIAREFMKLFIPSHAKRVKLYEETERPLLQAFNVEDQLDAMHHPVVQLRSGGYLVINPTEALVTIDVNSGRATRERHIEETALRTNLEASDEIARQLRLRDLAGLIVVDFIDMEVPRNQGLVERRIKDAMKGDRARTQIGRISPFGLLELSRQRMRPSLLETSFEVCAHCRGSGVRRSTESTALAVLRKIEEEGSKHRAAEINVAMPTAVAMYLLNHKRRSLLTVEERFDLEVSISADDTLIPPDCRIERLRPAGVRGEEATTEVVEEVVIEEPVEAVAEKDDGGKRGRRRRGRRRRRSDEDVAQVETSAADDEDAELVEDDFAEDDAVEDDEEMLVAEGSADSEEDAESVQASEPGKKRRRRGKRGGRRRSRRGGERDAALPADSDRPASVDDDGLMVAVSDAESDRVAGSDDLFDAPWLIDEPSEDEDVSTDLVAIDADASAGDDAEAGEAAEGVEAPVAKRPRARRKTPRTRKAAEAADGSAEHGAPDEPLAAVASVDEAVVEPTVPTFVPDYRDRAVTGAMADVPVVSAEAPALQQLAFDPEGLLPPTAEPVSAPASELVPEPAAEPASEPAPQPATEWMSEWATGAGSELLVDMALQTTAPTEPGTAEQAAEVPAAPLPEADASATTPPSDIASVEPMATEEPSPAMPEADGDQSASGETERVAEIAATPVIEPAVVTDTLPMDVPTEIVSPAVPVEAFAVEAYAVTEIEPSIAADVELAVVALSEPVVEPVAVAAGLDVASLLPPVAIAEHAIDRAEIATRDAEVHEGETATAPEDLRRTQVVHVGEHSDEDHNAARRGWWSRFLN